MTRVVTIVKILPDDVDTPPEKIIEAVKGKLPRELYEVLKSRIEPVAFGINAIYLWIAMPESIEGGTTNLEELLADVAGVSQVDIITVSRLIE
ncbi:MAG: elongation factor 1-beta [Thermofilaceae archaeon]